jgi:ABC-type Zn uptake system ZnuABC Zn-binding protein ZnuA
MIMIIILTLSFLVALNFFLLIFSCNKSSQKESTDRPHVLEKIFPQKVVVSKVTTQLPSAQLAPTGS